VLGGAAGIMLGALVYPSLAARAAADYFEPALGTAGVLVACASATAVLSAWWPARTVHRVDPLEMLREVAPLEPATRAQSRRLVPVLLAFAVAGLAISASTGNPCPPPQARCREWPGRSSRR
jgi:hypothetical protein